MNPPATTTHTAPSRKLPRLLLTLHLTLLTLLTLLLTLLTLLLAPPAPAADSNYTGGSGNITGLAAGDTVTIISANSSTPSATYTYTYTDPTTLATSTITILAYKTASAISNQFTLGTITLKSDQYATTGGWANLYGAGGGSDARALQFNEAGAGLTTNLNLQNIVFSGFYSSNNIVRVQTGGNSSSNTNINGNIAFISNTLSTTGGLVMHQGASNLVFTGTILAANNYNSNHGFFYINSTGPMIFQNTAIFLSNTVGGSNNAGAIYMNSGAYLIANGNMTFMNNSAYRGGALFFNSDSLTTANDDTIFNGNAIFAGNEAVGGMGGAIAYRSALTPGYVRKLIFNGSLTLQNNTANSYGGGVSLEPSRQIQLYGSVLATGNRAGSYGGAISSSEQTVLISNNTAAPITFLNNAAATLGGAINTDPNAAVLITTPASAVRFNNNVAYSTTSGNGGAINTGTLLTINAATLQFLNNQATGLGGAINLSSTTTAAPVIVSITAALTASNNISGSNGAFISATTTAAPLAITIAGSGTIANNAAAGLGGAIYASAASTTITLNATTGNITLTGNTHNATVDSTLIDPVAVASGSAPQMTATGGTPNDIYLDNPATTTLNFQAAATTTITLQGGIAAADTTAPVTINKTGSGVLVLDTNTTDITTNTTITEGTLKLANNATYGNAANAAISTLTLAANATLAGAGTINAKVTAPASSIITVGDLNATTPATLNFASDLSIANATLNLDLFGVNNPAANYDKINIIGTLTATGLNTISLTNPGPGNYTLTLLTAATLNAAPSNFSLLINGAAPPAEATLSISGNNLLLNYAGSAIANIINTWSGATLWASNAPFAGSTNFNDGDHAIFDTTGAATNTISISSAGVTVAQMDVNSPTDYTFTAAGSIRATTTPADTTLPAPQPTGKLVKTGPGTLNFTNTGTNTFAGGIDLAAGAITFTNGNQLNTTGATINILGPTTLRALAATSTLASNIAIAPATTGTLDTQANTLTYTGLLTAATPASTLVKTGPGTLILTANNAPFTGSTQIAQGTLAIATGATLGGAITIATGATLAGSGALTGSVDAHPNSTITIGDDTTTPSILTIGTLALNTTTLDFTLYASNTSGKLHVTTLTGATLNNTININSGYSGTYNLGTGISALNAATITIDGNAQAPNARTIATLQASGADLILYSQADNSRAMHWTGANGALWTGINWTDKTTKDIYANGDTVIFDSTTDTASPANRTITLATAATISDMIVQGAANYTFDGAAGITADPASIIPGAIANPTGKLTKTGPGTLTFANTGANLFLGGIDLAGGTLAFTNGAQLATSASTAITITADTTLAPLATTTLATTIHLATGANALINTATAITLTLTGTLAGPGTINKTGQGTLTYSGDQTLSTRTGTTTITDGDLRLRNIANPAATTATFLLNGGTLNLSNTPYNATGATANDWAALTLQATNAPGSAITGSNDKITFKNTAATTFAPSITGGIFVAIDTGTATLQLTGTNTYTGYTIIRSGELRLTAPTQIGSRTGADAIIFDTANTGHLNITTNLNMSTRGITLLGSGTIQVASNITTQWATINSADPTLTFTKTGDGTLTLTGSSNFAGKTQITNGTLQLTNANALGQGPLYIGSWQSGTDNKGNDITYITAGTLAAGANNLTLPNPITLNSDYTTIDTLGNTLTLTGTITGFKGTLLERGLTKTGTGTLVIASPNNSYGPTHLLAGTLRAAAPQAISKDEVTINPSATLLLDGHPHTFTNINNNGALRVGASPTPGATITPATLNLTGNYYTAASSTLTLNAGSNPAGQLVTDRLDITGKAADLTVAGNARTRILFATSLTTGDTPIYNTLPADQTLIITNTPVVTATGGGIATAFTAYGLDANGVHYNLADNGRGGLIFIQQGFAPPLIGAIATDAAACFISKATNESLSRRYAALRSNTPQPQKTLNLWLNATNREDTMTHTLIPEYDRAKNTTQGIQFGADLLEHTPEATFAFGAYATYATGNMKIPNDARTKATATGAGIYGQASTGPWYATLMFRATADQYTISSEFTAPFKTRGASYGASLEAGYDVKLRNTNWIIEPQAQLTLNRSNIRGALDSNGYYYTFTSMQTTAGRAGIKALTTYQYTAGKNLTPYIRISAEHDITGDSYVSVNTTQAPSNLGGTALLLDTGLTLQIARRADLTADLGWHTANHYKGYSLNAGIRLFW